MLENGKNPSYPRTQSAIQPLAKLIWQIVNKAYASVIRPPIAYLDWYATPGIYNSTRDCRVHVLALVIQSSRISTLLWVVGVVMGTNW